MTVEATEDQITAREIALRTIAGMNAIASTEMEGLAVSNEVRSDLQAWATGKITIEEALARSLARCTYR